MCLGTGDQGYAMGSFVGRATKSIATVSYKYKLPSHGAICLTINRYPESKQTHNYSGCTGQVNDVAGVRARRPHGVGRIAYNLLTQHVASCAHEQGRTFHGSLILAKITLSLTLTELNAIPGGASITPGEPITASVLTEEQRTVLKNHRGLLQEALRQLKAAIAEEKTPATG